MGDVLRSGKRWWGRERDKKEETTRFVWLHSRNCRLSAVLAFNFYFLKPLLLSFTSPTMNQISKSPSQIYKILLSLSFSPPLPIPPHFSPASLHTLQKRGERGRILDSPETQSNRKRKSDNQNLNGFLIPLT